MLDKLLLLKKIIRLFHFLNTLIKLYVTLVISLLLIGYPSLLLSYDFIENDQHKVKLKLLLHDSLYTLYYLINTPDLSIFYTDLFQMKRLWLFD